MKQIATVKSVSGDTAVVQVVRQGACGDNCSMCGICNNAVMEITATCKIAVTEGDKVWLESDSKNVLGALSLIFFVPVALPLAAFVIGQALWNTASGVVLAAVCLAATVAVICWLGRSRRYLKKMQASIVAKYNT